ncbi:MAG TPA: branched-chain amino acid ABC transporter permease [Candidatus Blautia excrementipullorum]|nr:branched-chain amino acid ABC transporter permease [Candidatus Blautia excrementipullorum]
MKLRKIFPAAIPVIVAVLFLAAISNNAYYLTIFVFCGIYVIAVSGLDILFGYSGQISLGHAMFYASGAYTSGILTTKFGVNPWLAILAGLLVTALLSFIVALPASRLVHQFLALLTIAAGNMMYVFLSKATSITNAMAGIRQIPDLSIFGYELHSNLSFAIFTLLAVFLFLFIKLRLINSSTGRAFMAIRENTTAAGGMGINVRKYKIMAFIISALFTSFAGSMYTHFVGYISPETFESSLSTMLMTMLLFGGMGNTAGPILGAVVIAVINESLQSFNTYKTLLYGILILVAVLFMPRGCYGLVTDLGIKIKTLSRKLVKKNVKN